MPELPEVQALAERLAPVLVGDRVERVVALSFSGLKTVAPRPEELVAKTVARVGRRGKFLVIEVEDGLRLLVHLGLSGGVALLVREHGRERKAGWWVLAPGDDGPLAALGPEAGSQAFAELVMRAAGKERLHTWLRDQRVVAGLGRGHTDDVLNRAGLSPFATPGRLDAGERDRLVSSVREVLAEALARERRRTGGLSAASLGDRFAVHNRKGEPCPRCGTPIASVSFSTYEIDYCSRCQTGGRVLADRRLSRLLR